MKRSKVLSVLLAVGLLLSNVACACASNAMSRLTTADETAHHHNAADESMGDSPCAHTGCDDCADLEDSCTTPSYAAASAERDMRATLSAQEPPDSGDLEFIAPGSDPPWHTPARLVAPEIAALVTPLPLETPVQRKDQLSE